jgi:2-keto-4-pentenoate hydratase
MTASITPAMQEGLRRQEALGRELLDQGAARLGWKAGFGTAAAMEKLGTGGPLVGFLTDATLAPSGSTVDVAGWTKPVLEPEVAVRLGADIGADQGLEQALGAIDAVGAAIELVDLGEVSDDAGAILAANIFHRHVLLGDFLPLDGVLEDVRMDVLSGGVVHAEAVDPAATLGPLGEVVRGLADLLANSPEGLRAGDVIITGAAIKPFELSGGETVEVRVGASAVAVATA